MSCSSSRAANVLSVAMGIPSKNSFSGLPKSTFRTRSSSTRDTVGRSNTTRSYSMQARTIRETPDVLASRSELALSLSLASGSRSQRSEAVASSWSIFFSPSCGSGSKKPTSFFIPSGRHHYQHHSPPPSQSHHGRSRQCAHQRSFSIQACAEGLTTPVFSTKGILLQGSHRQSLSQQPSIGSQSFLAADNVQRGKKTYAKGYPGSRDIPTSRDPYPLFDNADRSRVHAAVGRSLRGKTSQYLPRKYLHTTRSSRVFNPRGRGLGQEAEGSGQQNLVAELRQKTLVRSNVRQLWAAYTKIVQADALPRLQSDDVTVLFQQLGQSIQSEEAMELMLQIALDINSLGKQLPQEAYELLLSQAIDHMPADQIKSTLVQIQGRRRFITDLIQFCDSNSEMKRLLGLYQTLTKAGFDLDGYSTYYQQRRKQTSELSRLILQWISSESGHVDPRLTERLLVFLLDCNAHDEVYATLARMSKDGHAFNRGFFTMAIHRFGRANKFDFMDMTLDLMRKQGLEPLEETHAAIIDSHSKAGNLREAQRAYQDILAAGLVPTAKTFGPMVEAVGKMGDFEMTKQLIDHMNASGVASNKYTLNALLQSLSNDPKLSEELFHEMTKQVEPSTVNYNMLIRTFQLHSDLDGAFKVFRSMISKGVQPDRYTFSSLLNLFATRGDAGGAEVFWNEMVDEHRVTPNVYAYGAMIHTYCTAEDMISAQSIYRQMIQAGIMPNHTIFGTLLGAYARRGDLTQMLSIYDAMRAEGLVANSYIYANLLLGLVNDGDMVAARRLYENMEEEGFGDNVLAHTILMKGYLDQGKVKESQEIYRNMITAGLIPNFETYAVMLRGHIRRGERKEGRALLDRILKTQVLAVPRKKDPLEDVAVASFESEGEEDMLLSRANEGHLSIVGTEGKLLKAGAKPNVIQTFTPLLDSYAKETNILAAKGMFKEIKDRGLEPNTITYTILMDGYRRAGDVESVLNIWHELFERLLKQWQMTQKESTKGGQKRPHERQVELIQDRLSTRASKLRRLLQHPISITMDSLSYSGRIQEVKLMWTRLERLGFDFDSANWNDYVIALARNGRLTEACAVFQEKLLPGLEIQREAEEEANQKKSLSSQNEVPEVPSAFQGRPPALSMRRGRIGDVPRVTNNPDIPSSIFRKPSSLLYPRTRTMAALADGLEDLLKFEDHSGKFKIDPDLSDPFTKAELEHQMNMSTPRAKKLLSRKKMIEDLLESYPRPFDNLEESQRKFLWTWIRSEFPRVLETLNEGMLVAANSVSHLNRHGSTLPIWTASVSDAGTTSADRKVTTPAESASSSSPSPKAATVSSATTAEETPSKSPTVAFTGFRPWRNLKAVIKDMERKRFLEERTQTVKEREERFDLLRGRKPKPYN